MILIMQINYLYSNYVNTIDLYIYYNIMETINKAALYERVSTLEQALEGYSLGAQDDKLTKHAEYMGYEIFDKYVDDGYSGSSLNRPAIRRLIGDIENARVNTVLIYKLDRLSRRVKDVLELVELFESNNVTLYSLTENIDLSSPFGRAALKMAATFSELERENIIERTAMGRVAKTKNGYYSCHGKPPFGYDYDPTNKVISINEIEADIVRDIFERYIGGYSLRKLNDYCAERYRLPYFKNEMACKSIIHRPIYAGYIDFKGELITAKNIEPIINLNMFLEAQDCAKSHKTRHVHDNLPYLLTGLLYCGKCGNKYVGKRRNHYALENGKRVIKYSYTTYGCSARLKSGRNYPSEKCNNCVINATEIEDYVDSFIKNLDIADIEIIDSENTAINTLDDKINALNNDREKLLDLYMGNIIDKKTYICRISDIDKKRQEKELIKREQSANNTPNYSALATIKTVKDMILEYSSASRDEKQKLLKLIINKIVIDGDRIVFDLKIRIE